ncbi:hypothetical protein CRD60_03360 [Bifidobacterium aemilianum]|uniref:Uncharacterized protein n=1 Tax=Bifidobacterium aemilianum TaxID=2493120 RepID=A0A366KC12_9BIFI|nr:hypothetical protein CRD60_03360 [Bifidobacterium aemilianum]
MSARVRNGHRPVAAQEPGHLLGRPDGGRQADSLDEAADQPIRSPQTQDQMGTAFAVGERMDLIDDDGLHLVEVLRALEVSSR